jgi:glycosyltransferase involved in cell wall biosynthesis
MTHFTIQGSDALDALDGFRIVATCELPPRTSCGGIDHVTWQVCRRLARHGADIELVAADPGSSERRESLDEGVRLVTVPGVDLSRRLGGEAVFARTMFREVRTAVAVRRPQLLVANGLHFQGSLALASLAGRTGTPLISTAHIAGGEHLAFKLRAALAVHERTIGARILKRSRTVIAVSESVARHLRRVGVPASKLEVVSNGVDLVPFDEVDLVKRDESDPHIIFVGRLVGNKGPLMVLDALAQLRSRGRRFTAEFIGDGPLRTVIQDRVHALGLGDLVSLSGHCTDVPIRMRRASILVRPSLTEGMPLAVLEALAARVCVVASRVDGTVDLIDHEETGLLFEPHDLAGFVAQLDRALVDRNLRSRLTTAGRLIAEARSWDATAVRTAEVFLAGVESFA